MPSPARFAAALTAACVASTVFATDSPVFFWTAAPARHLSGSGRPELPTAYRRPDLVSRLAAWRAESPSAQRTMHLLLMDELHADELTLLASSRDAAASAALAAVSAAVVGSRDALVAPRAALHGDGGASLRQSLEHALGDCALVEVAAAGEPAAATQISRAQYSSVLGDSSAAPPAAGCAAYIVPLRHGALVSELDAVARFSALASEASPGRHTFLFAAEAAPAPAYAAADAEGEAAAAARQLQAPAAVLVYTAVGNLRITPGIVTGLVISLFLAFAVLVGVQCTMAIKTPDVMHSFALPAGREY